MTETIDKISWLHITNRKLLVVKSFNKDKFYSVGGKREPGESDEQALVREAKEELGVDLKPETIKYLHTFTAQAHGKPEGTMVKIAGYDADFSGDIAPQNEIEEMTWFTSADLPRASEPGKLILAWLKEQDLID